MSTINYAFKELSCKIVYYGTGLCGKTTNLLRIHESIPTKHRGDLVSLATEHDRTLFFDFLPIDLGEIRGFRTKIQIYTVPGQVFYNATRKLVLRGVDGIVFVVDSAAARFEENVESWKNMMANLAEYGASLGQIPYVIQYNKRDLPDAVPIERLQAALNPDDAPYIEAIAAQGQGVKETLKRISAMVLAKLRRVTDAEASQETAGIAGRKITAPATGVSAAATAQGAAAASRTTARSAASLQTSRQTSRQALSVKQRCDVYWGSVRVGKGFVEFTDSSARQGPGGETQPGAPEATRRVSVDARVVLFFRRRFEAPLRAMGVEIRKAAQDEVPYETFGSVTDESQGPGKVFVWIRKGNVPTLYMRCHGPMMSLTLTPEGKGRVF